jgi:hypothetical protein
MMTKEVKSAKEKIKSSIVSLSKLNATKPNAFNTSLDAKSDEIVSIFSGGPSITIDLVNTLHSITIEFR